MFTVIAIIAALFFTPPPETCESIHSLVGGELVEWIGYPQGWNLPSDLKRTARVDFDNGGVWAYHSESDHARYLWIFVSYTEDGVPEGYHDFCGPYRVSD